MLLYYLFADRDLGDETAAKDSVWFVVFAVLLLRVRLFVCVFCLLSLKNTTLVPTPGFLPPGYSLFSCISSEFPSTWGNPEVGGGDKF